MRTNSLLLYMLPLKLLTSHHALHVDVSRPDKLASAEIASICQAAGLQGSPPPASSQDYILTVIVPPAVRKNRYIVLPIDFEEAWKVRDANVTVITVTRRSRFFFLLTLTNNSAASRQAGRRHARVL